MRTAADNDLIITPAAFRSARRPYQAGERKPRGRLDMREDRHQSRASPLALRFGDDWRQNAFIGLLATRSQPVTFLTGAPFVLRLGRRDSADPPAARRLRLGAAGCALRVPARADQRCRRRRAVLEPGSGVLSSCVQADGLVDNPPGQAVARGDLARFIPFSELLN